MKRLWHRGLELLTPGVRVLLAVLSVVYFIATVGIFSRFYDLNGDLALSGPTFWSGDVWRIVTYALLPGSLLNFIMNGLMIIFLGGVLERVWSRGELGLYVVLVVMGAGVTKVMLQSSLPFALVGTGPLIFGLLAAWGFLFRREKVTLGMGRELTIGLVALLAGALSFVMTWISSGLENAVIVLSGGLTGLFYLAWQAKKIATRPSEVVRSGRIRQLEL